MSDVFNIDNARSYASEEHLLKVLKKLGLDDKRPLVVLNRQHRFTAVFGLHNADVKGDVTFAARHGFKTID